MAHRYGRPTLSTLTDGFYFDAFGRLRVAEPQPLIDSMSEYGNNPFFWEYLAVGDGSMTHIPLENALRLSTGGVTDTNKFTRQTKQYLRYQPGRSLNLEQTFVMSAPVTNAVSRVGYFDDDNGIFFERNGEDLYIVRRTNVTGTPVEERIAQQDWNKDIMTGTSHSGITLNVEKTQILFIQLQYLGVGRVEVGFVIDGEQHVCHEFLNANSLNNVYMSTGCLPVRGEVENVGTASGTATMDMICTTVYSGGLGSERVRFSKGNQITLKATSTTLIPLISVRAAEFFGGLNGAQQLKNRGHIEPQSISYTVASQTHEILILIGGTLTGASWSSVDTLRSIAEFDISATTITGYTIIDGTYGAATAAGKLSDIADITKVYPLVYSGLLGTKDMLTIAARAVSGTGTAGARITWDEQY